MKKIFYSLALIAMLSNCTSNAGTGAIAGSVVGAGTGGLIAGGKGALIGGAVGALSGGLIGAYLDAQDRKTIERSSPRTLDRIDRGEPLTINDIIKLSQAGVNDHTIIRYIRDTGSSYNLSQTQVRRLQEANVSQTVISYMIDTQDK